MSTQVAATSTEEDGTKSEASSVAQNIDGKAIAATVRQEIADAVKERVSDGKTTPGLAVVLIGSRRDSQTYVRMKRKACDEVGFVSFGYELPDTATQEEVLEIVQKLNARSDVHGILVQLPLPPHMSEGAILEAIHPSKDVDGLHPANVAMLSTTSTHSAHASTSKDIDWTNLAQVPFHIPCTPQGCIELLDRSSVPLRGKRAVIIGRSNLVGLPVSLLLLHRDATVTIVHSKTQDIDSVVRQADIVVAAVGRANLVKSTWLSPKAVVIDVGINSIDDPTAKRGYRLVGDCDYDSCREVASAITPVPGGVGPMTIAMLLRNTLNACRRLDDSS